jgi:hypothetical protein
MDNFYNTPALVQADGVGTLQLNRKNVLKSVKNRKLKR